MLQLKLTAKWRKKQWAFSGMGNDVADENKTIKLKCKMFLLYSHENACNVVSHCRFLILSFIICWLLHKHTKFLLGSKPTSTRWHYCLKEFNDEKTKPKNSSKKCITRLHIVRSENKTTSLFSSMRKGFIIFLYDARVVKKKFSFFHSRKTLIWR